jgi:hypothetical protein
MRFVRNIVGDHYFDVCLSALAVKFGHPNYDRLSLNCGLVIFLFAGDKEALFLAQVSKNSPVTADFLRSGMKDVGDGHSSPRIGQN